MPTLAQQLTPFESSFTLQPSWKIAIVVGRFNELVNKALLAGALATLERLGATPQQIEVVWVPGAVEMPVTAQWLSQHCDAVVALGTVIEGGTSHYDYVCSMVASGLQSVALATGKPVVFGVLTTHSLEQALERAGSKLGNKGSEAILTAVEMLHVRKHCLRP
jgi:6,7-dimethyl-8-ribityllumazine synthase